MYSINHQFGADANQSKLEKRMVDLEANNRQQERDFSILKTKAVEDKQEISKLRGRVDRLEGSAHANIPTNEIVDRKERPARLLPVSYL